MEEAGGDRHDVEFEIGEDLGHLVRMLKKDVARIPELAFVCSPREGIRLLDQAEVGVVVVRLDFVNQDAETQAAHYLRLGDAVDRRRAT